MKTTRQQMYLTNNIAREIAGENDGKIPDVFSIEARLKAMFEGNPSLLDLDRYVKSLRKEWEKINHEVLIPDGLTGVRFVPGAFLVVGKRARVIMKSASPTDVVAWQQVDDDAEKNFLSTIRMRTEYRNRALREFASNRDCQTLGDLEAKLHGYVETPDDEVSHLIIPTAEDVAAFAS